MSDTSLHGMELLTDHDVPRINRVTPGLRLRPDWVVVVLDCAREGREIMCPDRKILTLAPGAALFEAWIEGVDARLIELPLRRTPRLEEDSKNILTGLHRPRLSGTHNYLRIPDRFEDRNG